MGNRVMSTCPYCNTKFSLPFRVTENVSTYSGSAIVATPCCQRAVKVAVQRCFVVTQYDTDRTEDDWGDEIKQVQE